MDVKINSECPKCHADRTLLDTTFGVPGYVEPGATGEDADCINAASVLPVKLVFCPRCHYLELYHDVEAKHWKTMPPGKPL